MEGTVERLKRQRREIRVEISKLKDQQCKADEKATKYLENVQLSESLQHLVADEDAKLQHIKSQYEVGSSSNC